LKRMFTDVIALLSSNTEDSVVRPIRDIIPDVLSKRVKAEKEKQ